MVWNLISPDASLRVQTTFDRTRESLPRSRSLVPRPHEYSHDRRHGRAGTSTAGSSFDATSARVIPSPRNSQSNFSSIRVNMNATAFYRFTDDSLALALADSIISWKRLAGVRIKLSSKHLFLLRSDSSPLTDLVAWLLSPIRYAQWIHEIRAHVLSIWYVGAVGLWLSRCKVVDQRRKRVALRFVSRRRVCVAANVGEFIHRSKLVAATRNRFVSWRLRGWCSQRSRTD